MLPFCTYCKIFASEAQRGRRRALISRNFRIVGCDFMLHLAANSWFKAHHLSRRFFCLDRSFLLNSVRNSGWRRGSMLARRLVLGEKVPADETFDLVVIGCGPAGEKAGAQAAYFSKRVAVIERAPVVGGSCIRSEEHTSELQSLAYLVCRLLLEKKKKKTKTELYIYVQ